MRVAINGKISRSGGNAFAELARTCKKRRLVIHAHYTAGVLWMSRIVELIPDPEYGGFTARVPDIPAYGEGRTEEDAIADMREAIHGSIETFGLKDALARVSRPSVRQTNLDLADLSHG